MLKVHRNAKFNIGLIERARTSLLGTDIAYAVVRSEKPILANGVLLRPLEAVPYRTRPTGRGRACKARDPEAWHSSLTEAEAKFRGHKLWGGGKR